MLSRFLLILAGLFTGLWLRGADGFLAEIGLPALALLALILAVATGPRSSGGRSRERLEEQCGDWLDAWHRLRSIPGDGRAEAMLRSATHRLLLSAPDRVIRSLRAAEQTGYEPDAVADLLVEMRRATGRVTVLLRREQIREMLDADPAAPEQTAPPTTPAEAAALW